MKQKSLSYQTIAQPLAHQFLFEADGYLAATGAIGRLSAILLSEHVAALTLVGNPMNPDAERDCRAVAGEIRDHLGDGAAGVPISCTCDLGALADADIVLVATSSDQALIQPEQLKDGAIVCDVARPSNVAPDLPTRRPDVIVFEGGLVVPPAPLGFGPELTDAPDGAREVAGAGFRDFTRIARSDADLWGDILTANGKALASPLQATGAAFTEIVRAIEAGEVETLERLIASGRETLSRMSAIRPEDPEAYSGAEMSASSHRGDNGIGERNTNHE